MLMLDSFNKLGSCLMKCLKREIFSWTALIYVYVRHGLPKETVKLFKMMQRLGDHAVEDLGKELHGYMTSGYEPYSFAESALIHLYSKCGNTENARKVFNRMLCPDLASWTSFIVGHAHNGEPEKAFHFFDLLLKYSLKLDQVTFVGVLSACAHLGLVDKRI